jgi:tubulin polyglutamylase TTLL4
MYIMKPSASSCGRGIKVIGKRQQVNKRSGYVVSQYVAKPHLIRGFKYDLRVYVMVTGIEPLKIYLFSEGLVRLATVPYTTAKGSLKKRFVHLTNYSVNRKATNYQKATGSSDDLGSKLSFAQLRKEYEKEGVSFDSIFEKIKDVIIKTIVAAETPFITAMGGSKYKHICHEIFGFDILIDSDFKPWLLEVNVLPSLSSSSQFDKQVKTLLLSDSLYLAGFNLYDRKIFEKDKAKTEKNRFLGFESAEQ